MRKKELVFYGVTAAITVGGFYLSTLVLQNEAAVNKRKRDAIFYDRLRMNERRVANGFEPLTDDDITDPDFLKQWQQFKKENGIDQA